MSETLGPGSIPVPKSFDAFVLSKSTAADPQIKGEVSTVDFGFLPAGEVIIEVEWSSINYKDAMVTVSGNRVARIDPLIPGVDLAGVVAWSSVSDLAPGTAVLAHGHDIGVARHGGFARYARVPRDWVIELPAGLSARDAMVFGTAGFTAALSLEQLENYGIRPGTGPVLVTGASGGVGSFAVSLLAAAGYEVVASSGKSEERQWLESLGASDVVGRTDWIEAENRTLAPERWSAAVDCVGGKSLTGILRSLKYAGAVAASGLTGGSSLEANVYPFIVRAVALLGVDTVSTPADVRKKVWERLATDLRPKDLEVFVDQQIGLSGLAEALADVLDAKIRGRILVRPAG